MTKEGFFPITICQPQVGGGPKPEWSKHGPGRHWFFVYFNSRVIAVVDIGHGVYQKKHQMRMMTIYTNYPGEDP